MVLIVGLYVLLQIIDFAHNQALPMVNITDDYEYDYEYEYEYYDTQNQEKQGKILSNM